MDLALWISKVYFVTCLLLRFRDVYTQGCKNMLFFTDTEGHYLQNHKIGTVLAYSSSECETFCYMTDRCQSINYRAANRTCDMNDSDHFQDQDDLVKSADWSYVATKNSCNTRPCRKNTRCQPNFVTGGFTCLCPQGYRGENCDDINECIEKTHNCTGYSFCVNTKGSFRCDCPPGFKNDVDHCDDINECMENMHNCTGKSICENTNGSFRCDCPFGYKKDGNDCFLLEAEYEIIVYTSSSLGAGTDSKVYIKVTGTHLDHQDTSNEMELQGDQFERGSVDKFNKKFENMNPLSKLTVRTVASGGIGDGWKLSKITIENKEQKITTTFDFNDWIKATDSKELSPSG